MQHLIEIPEIKSRAEAINLTLKRLARLAGVHFSTVYRGANGVSDTRVTTLRKLTDELVRQEARVRGAVDRVEDAA